MTNKLKESDDKDCLFNKGEFKLVNVRHSELQLYFGNRHAKGYADLALVPKSIDLLSVLNLVRVLFELKTVIVESHVNQLILEFLASTVTSNHPVLGVLTDFQNAIILRSSDKLGLIEKSGVLPMACAMEIIVHFINDDSSADILVRDEFQDPAAPTRKKVKLSQPESQLAEQLNAVDDPMDKIDIVRSFLYANPEWTNIYA